jgi:hypothetical protein
MCKAPDFLNLPNGIPIGIRHDEFPLGLASARKIPIPDISIKAKIGITPNPIFEQKRKDWRERDLEIELKIKKQYKEIDNDNSLLDHEKQTIKGLVVKTDGYYKLVIVKKFVDTIDQRWEKELADLSQPSNDSVPRWIDEIDNQIKLDNEERNVLIQRIRHKFTFKNQKNRHNRYGGYPSEYKSPYHRELFLEIVEAAGLVRQSESKSKLKYTFHVIDEDNTEVEDFTGKQYDLEFNSNKYQGDEF